MSKEVALLTQLHDLGIEHIGEINLVLDALHDGPHTYGELEQIIFRMAARSDRIPKARLLLAIASELGIVQKNGIHFELTSLGLRLYNESVFPPYDVFNPSQIETITPEILGHPDLVVDLESTLQLFTQIGKDKKILRLDSIPLSETNNILLQILQALGIGLLNDQYIQIETKRLKKLREIIGLSAVQTEEELWQTMQQINKRAREVEEFIVEYEKKRLIQKGFDLLAQSVDRVSKYDTKANYDIRSYNSDGSIRFIEVKSSTNLRVEFFWSEGERQFAKIMGDAYWIYFVPRAHELPNLRHGIVIIHNPHNFIGTKLFEEPTNFKIRLVDKLMLPNRRLNKEDIDSVIFLTP